MKCSTCAKGAIGDVLLQTPLSFTTSRTVFWLSPKAQSVLAAEGGTRCLVRQNLVHRRTPQVAVREIAVAVEGQDHVRAVEDVTLRARVRAG